MGIRIPLLYRFQSILEQKYYGDITIVPEITSSDYMKLIASPTPETVIDCAIRGEKATWPRKYEFSFCHLFNFIDWITKFNKVIILHMRFFHFQLEISIIKNHCLVELCIDDIIYR